MEVSRFFSKLYNEYLKLRPLKINELFGKFLYSKNAPGWYEPLSVFFEKDTFEKKFSWVYKKLSKDKKDAFIEAGVGFGKSFDYIFPFRIDFILTDTDIKIQEFNTYKVNYSDHYPIMTKITL